MYEVEPVYPRQEPSHMTLPDLGIEVTDGAHGEYREAIRHQFPDPVTPYVHKAVGNEVQPLEIIGK